MKKKTEDDCLYICMEDKELQESLDFWDKELEQTKLRQMRNLAEDKYKENIDLSARLHYEQSMFDEKCITDWKEKIELIEEKQSNKKRG